MKLASRKHGGKEPTADQGVDRPQIPMAPRPKVAGTVGAAILLLTSAVHATAYPDAVAEVASPPVDQFMHDLLPGMWLFFAWHLAVVALGVLWVCWRRRNDPSTLIAFAAAVTAGDTVWVGFLAGWTFFGTWLLAIAAACLVAATMR